jgi:hypothetical protein
MSSGFVASLSSELGCEFGEGEGDVRVGEEEQVVDRDKEPRVNVQKKEWYDEGELGDSCCFGTRTVDVGLDCVWKLHGGV